MKDLRYEGKEADLYRKPSLLTKLFLSKEFPTMNELEGMYFFHHQVDYGWRYSMMSRDH